MESVRKKHSLRWKFFDELHSIFRIPTSVSATRAIRPAKPQRREDSSATENSQVVDSPNSATTTINVVQPDTVVQKSRITERIKSIKRVARLNKKFSSMFQVNSTEVPSTAAPRQASSHRTQTERCMSVDDLLEMGSTNSTGRTLVPRGSPNVQAITIAEIAPPPFAQRPTSSRQQMELSPAISLDSCLISTTNSDIASPFGISDVPRRFSSAGQNGGDRSDESEPRAAISGFLSKSSGEVNKITNITPLDYIEGLGIREKVVWFSDKDKAEIGIVKWLGKINEIAYAGIEFENNVGNSSGIWNGRRLFSVSLTKGRFVPIRELVLWADYSLRLPQNLPAKITYPSWERSSAGRKTGVVICVICQDSLLGGTCDEDDEPCQEDREREIVTTPCGHIFHSSCLKKWFNVKSKTVQPCPYCQCSVPTTEKMMRVFLVQEEMF